MEKILNGMKSVSGTNNLVLIVTVYTALFLIGLVCVTALSVINHYRNN